MLPPSVASPASSACADPHDAAYSRLLLGIQTTVKSLEGPLFTTPVTDLYQTFLSHLPPESRQHYTCRACQKFVDTYGSLVQVAPDGKLVSAIWSKVTVEPHFVASIVSMRKAVESSRIRGVFLAEEKVWGTPVTGSWHHFSGVPPKEIQFKSHLTPHQASAEKRGEYEIVSRALFGVKMEVVERAVTLLRTGQLARGEKIQGAAEWFHQLQKRVSGKGDTNKVNLVWLAVAAAPAGFTHIRSGMLGMLLEDLTAGLPLEDIQKRFAAKMDPLQYLRPSAPPAEGAIQAAEWLVEQMGLAPSLARRFARWEDIQEFIWKKKEEKVVEKSMGVFAHLRAPTTPVPVEGTTATTITWTKFARAVLPLAERIWLSLEGDRTAPFYALVTAVNPDAPPIVRWDREEKRNPVTWYTRPSGSMAGRWSLAPGWLEIPGICAFPNQWGEGKSEEGGVILITPGIRDLDHKGGGGLFPEHVRGELHGIRSVIESNSESVILDRNETGCAGGYGIRHQVHGSSYPPLLRVEHGGVISLYRIDRWD